MPVEIVPLARALAKEVEMGHPVPTKWYPSVAEAPFLFYKLRKKAEQDRENELHRAKRTVPKPK